MPVGIPDRDVYGDPTTGGLSQGQLVDWIVQRHEARRAGLHHDVRFGTPETGLYSWAVRKGLPSPGQKHLAVQQPIHSHDYRNFEGEIPEGYGAGKVRKHDEGQVMITKLEPNAVHFTTAHRRYPERFTLVKPKAGRNWLLINTTPTEAVPYEKVHYASIPAEQAEATISRLQPGSSVQAKIDGAASLTKLFKDNVEVVSYRTAKNTGHPIVHTERVFGGRPQVSLPKGLAGSVLRGELYGVGPEGKAIPAQQLGGLLNSTVSNSLASQGEQRVKMRNLIFDIQRHGQNPVGPDVPYSDRLNMVRDVVKHLPQDTFHTPEEAKTPEEAMQLLRQIQEGRNPLTHEGLVIHPAQGKPTKMKFMDEHDVHIRGVFPGQGKYQGVGAGGFQYSHTPTGPVMGEVGTGFDDPTRQDMHANPNEYIGRIAKVRAQQKFPSGALRAPSFLSLHEDAPATPMAKLPGALQQLRKAKMESDRKNWPAKHDLVRQAIRAEPHNFMVDSEQAGISGLTHVPTGFKIHLPSAAVPVELRSPQE